MKIIPSRKLLFIFSYLYLYIPILIFFIGWVRPIFSVPIILSSLYCLFSYFKKMENSTLKICDNKKKLFIIIGIIFIWVFLSGIGGFAWQNRWDHMFRNAIFHDLVTNDWPVVNSDGENPLILCYYIGYWLPCALIAKLFNSIILGYSFQLFWGFVGVVLTFLLISEWLKKISYKTLMILIFFSGLDIIIYVIMSPSLKEIFSGILGTAHVELLLYLFNSSSNTTLLFWLYNQIIPFWVGFMLILLQKNNKYLFFTYSFLILFAPFPALALIPAIIFLELKNNNIVLSNTKIAIRKFIQNYLTFENITGLSILIIIALYYRSNLAADKLKVISFLSDSVIKYAYFLFLEYGIFIIFIYKKTKTDYLFYIIILTMMLLSFIQLGDSYDFAWRTAIPATFYLMLVTTKYLVNFQPGNKIKYGLLITVLVLGSFTPSMEILRTIKYTFTSKGYNQPFLSGGLESVFIDNPCYKNFIGQEDSFFYKYIMKRNYSKE